MSLRKCHLRCEGLLGEESLGRENSMCKGLEVGKAVWQVELR